MCSLTFGTEDCCHRLTFTVQSSAHLLPHFCRYNCEEWGSSSIGKINQQQTNQQRKQLAEQKSHMSCSCFGSRCLYTRLSGQLSSSCELQEAGSYAVFTKSHAHPSTGVSVISHTMYPVPLLRGTEILVITFHFNRAEWQVKMLVKMIYIFCFSHLHTTNWTHRWTASSIQAWGSRGSRWPWKSWGSLCSRLTLLRDLELQPAMLVWISL